MSHIINAANSCSEDDYCINLGPWVALDRSQEFGTMYDITAAQRVPAVANAINIIMPDSSPLIVCGKQKSIGGRVYCSECRGVHTIGPNGGGNGSRSGWRTIVHEFDEPVDFQYSMGSFSGTQSELVQFIQPPDEFIAGASSTQPSRSDMPINTVWHNNNSSNSSRAIWRNVTEVRIRFHGNNSLTYGASTQILGYYDGYIDICREGVQFPEAADFWRTSPGAQLPDANNDETDSIRRQGSTAIGGLGNLAIPDVITPVTPNSRLTLSSDQDQLGQLMFDNNPLSFWMERPVAAIGETTRIGRLTSPSGAHNVRLSVTVNNGGFATAKQYHFVAQYNEFAAGVIIPPEEDAGPFGANDWELMAFMQLGVLHLRLRRTGGTTAGTYDIRLESLTDGDTTFDDEDTVDANANVYPVLARMEDDVEFPYNPIADCITRVSLDGEVSWSDRLIQTTFGTNGQLTGGFHSINMPAVGTVIPVNNGTDTTVVAQTVGARGYSQWGGIPLAAWQTLWYRIPDGSGVTSSTANFKIEQIAQATDLLDPAGSEPNDWIPIVSRDATDRFHWHVGSNNTMSFGWEADGGDALLTKQMYDGYVKNWEHSGFAYVSHNGSKTARRFGLTGRLRFIGGGRNTEGSPQGYIDIDQADRANGRAIIGVGGLADTAWETAVASDQISWYGGNAAAGQVNAIGNASTFAQLSNNEQLYYCPDSRATHTRGNWYRANYLQDAIPPHWILIAHTGDATITQAHVALGYNGGQQLRTGEAKFGSTNDGILSSMHDGESVSFNGWLQSRWSHADIFSGTGTNQRIGSDEALLIGWEDNRLMMGAGAGYEDADLRYMWLNVPASGFQIPVVGRNGATRQVLTIGGTRYIPLGTWEALWYIPPQYSGTTTGASGGFVILNLGDIGHIDKGAWLIASPMRSQDTLGRDSSRIKFIDGTILHGGVSFAVGTPAQFDHAHGTSTLWRNIIVAGETPPAATAGLPAITGVSRFANPYNPRYLVEAASDGGRKVTLRGLINATANIDGNPAFAFIPGAWFDTAIQPIATAYINTDNGPVHFGIRFTEENIGGQNGIGLRIENNELSNTQQRWNAGIARRWISLDNITFYMTN